MSNSSTSIAGIIARSRVIFRSKFFDVKALSSLQDPAAALYRLPFAKRCVVVVPKKVGSAPVRNRCRRRIKGLIPYSLLVEFPGILIFFVRLSFADLPAQDLRDLLALVAARIPRRL